MWKDFFYYSKSERRAVYVLLVLMALLLAVMMGLPERRGEVYPDSTGNDSTELVHFLAGIKGLEEKQEAKSNHSYKRDETVRLKAFNPNIADSIELSRLGLSAFVVRNVMKYREKGGYFPTAASFSRIYGLTAEQFERLRPYICIPEAVPAEREERPFKYPKGTLVDVNVADTSELKKIPGIGSVIARRIVAYRRQLGGFYQVSQLEEVEYVTPEIMGWFKVESGEIRKLQVNQLSLDKLRSHPYLNFYQAKAIVEYRRKRGNIKSLSQLSLWEEFTEKDLERLSHYLAFD